MLRIVLLAALLLTAGVVALPEAAANNICEETVKDYLAGGCSPRGIACRDVLPIVGVTC